jgi:photosynthetic reaction center H subunit
MSTGAITSYIDVAQVTLYAFWIFFAGLIFYLRREDKREGYPLESERSDRVLVQGFPAIPPPKVFLLPHGGTVSAPRGPEPARELQAAPSGAWPGAPLEPTGDPLRDGVGPAAWAMRADVPDVTIDNQPKIRPLRVATDYFLDPTDPDPRGMVVVGADGLRAGTIADVWVDRSETIVRYLEVALDAPPRRRAATAEGEAAAPAARHVLLPMTLARVSRARHEVKVGSILASQFAGVPTLASPDLVTLREEDRISAYYAGGQLYATPDRLGPLL